MHGTKLAASILIKTKSGAKLQSSSVCIELPQSPLLDERQAAQPQQHKH